MTDPADLDQDACGRLVRDATEPCPRGMEVALDASCKCGGTGQVPRFPALVEMCPGHVRPWLVEQQQYAVCRICDGTGLVANVTVEGMLAELGWAGGEELKLFMLDLEPNLITLVESEPKDVEATIGRLVILARLAASRAFVAAMGLA